MTSDPIVQLLPRIRWYPTSTGLPQQALPKSISDRLPDSFLAVHRHLGAGEGFVGPHYLRLYPIEELTAVNEVYEVQTFVPDLFVFGSDGSGTAYAFTLDTMPVGIVEIPFLPLDLDYSEPRDASFLEFFRGLAESPPDVEGPFPPLVDEAALGKEVWERHPTVLGGSASPENQVLADTSTHARLCVVWNKAFRHLKSQASSSE
jgi:hypothetical protein